MGMLARKKSGLEGDVQAFGVLRHSTSFPLGSGYTNMLGL